MTVARTPTVRLSTIELLLTGHPTEFLDIAVGDQHTSDRQRLTAAAGRWIGVQALADEERERIAAVWTAEAPEYRPPLVVTRQRREQLAEIARLMGVRHG